MPESGAARVLRVDDLAPAPGRTARFEGREHGANVCFFVSRVPAGGRPGLHTHPYEETFVIHDGSATFVVGDTVEAEPDMIIIVPAETPHFHRRPRWPPLGQHPWQRPDDPGEPFGRRMIAL